MVAEEFHSDQEAGNEESILLQDPDEEEEEGEEEALSLCDLPIYSDSAQWGDFSKEDGQNSSSLQSKNNDEDNDDFFEFFREDTNTTSSSTSANAENIIFCGKLIPFKEHPQQKVQKSNNTKHNVNNSQKGSVLLPSDKAKPTSKTVKSSDDGSFRKGQEAKGSESFMLEKVSLMRSTTKSRWCVFMFGNSSRSLSTEMELRDIRMRQSRRRLPATMFPAPEHGGEVKSKERMRMNHEKGKGLWRMLRSSTLCLGCSSRNKLANDAAKAAFV